MMESQSVERAGTLACSLAANPKNRHPIPITPSAVRTMHVMHHGWVSPYSTREIIS
jgi:hypothetical protein